MPSPSQLARRSCADVVAAAAVYVCFVTGDVGVKLRVSDAGEVSVEVTA